MGISTIEIYLRAAFISLAVDVGEVPSKAAFIQGRRLEGDSHPIIVTE